MSWGLHFYEEQDSVNKAHFPEIDRIREQFSSRSLKGEPDQEAHQSGELDPLSSDEEEKQVE